MKKSIFALAMAFGVTSAFAQDLTSKKGEPILPEADDWSIGIEATPFLNYAGNFLNGNAGNAAPTWNFLNGNNQIIGKMFKDEKTAYRIGVRLGFVNQSYKNQIGQATTSTTTFPNLPPMVEDKASARSTNIGISVGMEKRRGKTRLQGFYGADLMLGISSSGWKFTYGNALAASGAVIVDGNDATYSTFWDAAGNSTGAYASGVNGNEGTYGGRATRIKNGTSIYFGVRAFIGAEYFVLPKISIGGEFGWGIGYMSGAKSKKTYEATNYAVSPTTGSYTVESKTGGKFMLDTDRNAFGTAANQFGPSGSLRMNFHF